MQKDKELNLGPKKHFFMYIWVLIMKSHCHSWTSWNQPPWIFQIAIICAKQKKLKSGTKNALIGYFWTVILKKVLSYFQTPLIWNKKRIFKYRTKNPSFGYFESKIFKIKAGLVNINTITVFLICTGKYISRSKCRPS